MKSSDLVIAVRIISLSKLTIIQNDAVQEAISNKDPYAGVPQWKKDLLIKRDQEKADYQRRLSADSQFKDDITKKFESKPDWKKEIILKRRTSQEKIL